MIETIHWVAVGTTLVALFAIRAYVESIKILNWYKHKYKTNPLFASPPVQPWWMDVINFILFLPKI